MTRLREIFINPDEWYDLDRFLLGMKDIQEKVGEEKKFGKLLLQQFNMLPYIFQFKISFLLKHMNRAYL